SIGTSRNSTGIDQRSQLGSSNLLPVYKEDFAENTLLFSAKIGVQIDWCQGKEIFGENERLSDRKSRPEKSALEL
ncbi:hypothetical protein LINPERPRIM_LOCUS5003, partial [Linum perenne]